MHDKPDNQNSPGSNELGPDVLNDEEFEAYLDGDSALSKTYRNMVAPEPPQALDRAILDEARAAIKPQRKDWLQLDLVFWRKWARPISTVVIMGTALAVVLQVIETTTVVPTELLGMDTLNGHGSMHKPTPSSASPNSDRTMATDRFSKESAASESSARIAAAAPDPGLSAKKLARQLAETDSTEVEDQMSAAPQPNDTDDDKDHVAGTLALAGAQAPKEEKSAATASDAVTPAVAVPRSRNTVADLLPPDRTLEAWNAGARPSADVWLAGIEASYGDYQSPTAIAELKKVAQVYPEEAEIYLLRRNAGAAAAMVSSETAGNAARAVRGTPEDRQVTLPADSQPVFPDPNIWAAGINKLYGDDNEKAAAERARLQQLYPDYAW